MTTSSKIPENPWSVLSEVAHRSQRYLTSLSERSVVPTDSALAAITALDAPLQDSPIAAETLIEELDRLASPATVAIAGPRYFGFVNSGALPSVLAANWLTTSWEQHGAFHVSSPGSTLLERVAMRWIIDLLGLPETCEGGFVTGTTAAHIAALATARDALLERVGWDVRTDGLFGAPPITVIVSDESHSTFFKGLSVVGLGRGRVVKIPVDGQGRMRADALPARLTGPTIVCLQAGNVNTGAFDPFRDVTLAVRQLGAPVWIHIDGAFGLWARATPDRAHLADGIDLADSWATDAHKWLNTPYDCGIVLVRQPGALRWSLGVTADYLPGGLANGIDHTLEGSRRPRGVDAWAALRSLGRRGLADLIERNCRQAKRFADAFAAAGLRVLNDVVLNQVLVTFGDDARTRAVIAGVQADGTCWCGATVWHGITAMRVSVVSWATTDEDVERSIEAILRAARACT